LIRKSFISFSILFLIIPAVSFSQVISDTTIIPEIEENYKSHTYYSIGFGSSAHFSPADIESHGRIFGYYLTASVTKGISRNFNVSSGIDAYSLPHYKNRMIGQLNLNTAYVHSFSKNITLTVGAGLFTGFISWHESKRAGGFVSGLLINSNFLYAISPDNAIGFGIKFPFLTEENRMLLSNLFFTF